MDESESGPLRAVHFPAPRKDEKDEGPGLGRAWALPNTLRGRVLHRPLGHSFLGLRDLADGVWGLGVEGLGSWGFGF